MLSVSAAKTILAVLGTTGSGIPEIVNARVADVESKIARFAKSEIPPGAVMLARGVKSSCAVSVTTLAAPVTVTDAPISKS